MATLNEYLEKALGKKVDEVRNKDFLERRGEKRMSLPGAPKQCQKCIYINSVDYYPSPDYTTFEGKAFCEHDIFDNMPSKLSNDMTRWLFSLANKMKCPLFKKGKK